MYLLWRQELTSAATSQPPLPRLLELAGPALCGWRAVGNGERERKGVRLLLLLYACESATTAYNGREGD